MRRYRIVLMGSGEVGKTSLATQFVREVFESRYEPTIEDLHHKTIEVDGEMCSLEVLDTAGIEQFAQMRNIHITEGQGFILIYSVASRNSFHDAQMMHEEIVRIKNVTMIDLAKKFPHLPSGIEDTIAQEMLFKTINNSLLTSTATYSSFKLSNELLQFKSSINGGKSVPALLVGNKRDLAHLREVTTKDGKDVAMRWPHCTFMETTAKCTRDAAKIFTEAARQTITFEELLKHDKPPIRRKGYCVVM